MLRWSLSLGLVLLSCGDPVAPTPTAPERAVVPAAAAEPAAATPAAQLVVRGRVLGHDGVPMRRAQVKLRALGEEKPRVVEAGADGRFEVAGGPGLVRVNFSGTDHLASDVVLLLEDAAVELTVKLGTHGAAEPGAQAVAMVWRTPDGQAEVVPLQKGANGLLSAEVDLPAGEVRYQVRGHVADHSTNGTRSDGFEPDGEGDFHSLLKTAGGKTRLEFDPAVFPPPDRPGSVEFADPGSVTAKIAGLARRRAELDTEHHKAVAAAMKDGGSEPSQPAGWPAFAAELATLAAGDAPAPVQRAALALSFSFPPPAGDATAAALARRALEQLGAKDPLWTLTRDTLANAIAATGAPDEFEALREAAIAGHPDPELGASLLVPQLARASKARDEATVRRLYARLQEPRFATTFHRMFATMYDPDRPLRVGGRMPAFELEMLDPPRGAASKIDLAALQGRPVLIDIWATWCVPCIAEMGTLHKLHTDLGRGPKGLEIVSVSVDDDPATVREFRRGEWKMPWKNAVVPAARSESFFTTLGIMGMPVAVLLDEHGTIVASSPDLAIAQVPDLLKTSAAAKPGSKSDAESPAPGR